MKKQKSILKLFAFSIALLASVNSFAQPGVGPAPYCMSNYVNIPCNQPNPSNTAGNSINDFIESFNTTGASINITNNNSSCNTQIITSTSSSENFYFVACPNFLQVLPGQVITCNFLSGIIYDQGFAVFVDWNQNNVYDMPGEQVCATPGVPFANTWATEFFTVPAVAAGNYRMRVRCAYATAGTTIRPCKRYSFGEAEEYNLIVGTSNVCPVPLPIELVSYEGTIKNNTAELTWITATEKNSDYFLIEKSYDNLNFEVVTKTVAAGNSNTLRAYTITDKNLAKNTIVYYRLKQFDNGNPEPGFSKTITLYSNNHNIGFDLFPNPANTEMTLLMPDALIGKTLSIGVYDNLGNKVLSSETIISNENTSQNFDINSLERGTYFIRVIDNSGTVMKKILIKQ